MRDDPSLLSSFKSDQDVPLECTSCGNIHFKKKKRIQAAIKHYQGSYCSFRCQKADRRILKNCAECDLSIEVRKCDETKNNFCSKKCAGSFNGRKRKHTNETKEKLRLAATGRTRPNTEPKVKKRYAYPRQCAACSTVFTTTTSAKYCSPECRKPYLGGPRERSGRSKPGTYKGIFCQSSYEFAFVYKSLKEGRKVIRNTEGFPYKDEAGKTRRYFPDFIIDGTYYEVKGYLTPRDELKFAGFPYSLIVIHKERMAPILEEVEASTGVHRNKFHTIYSNLVDGE